MIHTDLDSHIPEKALANVVDDDTPQLGGDLDLNGQGIEFPGATVTDVTGADTTLVSGTAGTDGNLAQWNADGDLVDGPDPTTYLLVDGSRELSADWDAGSHQIRAETLQSDVTTGTAPLVVASTTVVTNLNADLLDGLHSTSLVRVDGSQAFSGNQSMGSNRLTNLATPSSGSDAATKTYVDQVAAGLKWRAPVRVATTANVSLGGDVENGDTLDGVTLATGDRILLKNQSVGSHNGIYVVNSSGAPTRATDMPAAGSAAGVAVFVQEGSTNGDTGWLCTSDVGSDVVGTDSLAFSQFTGGGTTDHGALTGLSDDDHTQYAKADGTRWTTAQTASRAVISDASGNLVVSDITTTELGYLDGVTSAIQTQLDGKAASSHNHSASEITSGTLPVSRGGTGATTLTDGGLLLGSGTGAVTAMSVLADGSIVVGDGTTAPVALAAFTSSTGTLKHERGGLEADISAVAIGDIVAGSGSGTMSLVTSTGHQRHDRLTRQSDGSVDWESPAIVAASDGATVTFDLADGLSQAVTLGGNRTLALSNTPPTGSIFTLKLVQDATGSRTVTWFSGISWAGGSAPTLTTTANKADRFVFVKTGSGAYEGHIVGLNI